MMDLVANLLLLLLIGMLTLLISSALAPLEALGWWAGWFGDQAVDMGAATPVGRRPAPRDGADHYLVYLSGIGSIAGNALYPDEAEFLQRLETALPRTVVIKDVFPYSVFNRALTGQRLFAWFWRMIYQCKLDGRRMLGNLINVRNLFQVIVSADNRYGPIYNYGSAEIILHGLLRQGYRVGSGAPVTLLGYSGGGQIALGAVTHLHTLLQAPIRVISLAGVMCADPGLRHVTHLYHLYGDKDSLHRIGGVVFPGRWRWMVRSPWNRALKAGKISFRGLGAIAHDNAGGYLDATTILPDGRSCLDHTVATITDLVASYVPPARTQTTPVLRRAA